MNSKWNQDLIKEREKNEQTDLIGTKNPASDADIEKAIDNTKSSFLPPINQNRDSIEANKNVINGNKTAIQSNAAELARLNQKNQQMGDKYSQQEAKIKEQSEQLGKM